MNLKKAILLPLAKKYIAGEKMADLVSDIKILQKRGFKNVANFLGEEASENHVLTNVKEYISLMEVLKNDKLTAGLSIKPTQVGLSISKELALKNFEAILERASSSEQFIWIDMEGSAYTESTLDLYYSFQPSFSNVGITLQAYLRRSEGDLRNILAKEGFVRVVKGAYKEPEIIAFANKTEARKNFGNMLELLFNQENFFSIGTHDERLLRLAISFSTQFNKRNFEFQFLKGVREVRALELVNSGYNVAIYVPYGIYWIPYLARRIKEQNNTTSFILRKLLGLQ
jgi:proline dehydrogenase